MGCIDARKRRGATGSPFSMLLHPHPHRTNDLLLEKVV